MSFAIIMSSANTLWSNENTIQSLREDPMENELQDTEMFMYDANSPSRMSCDGSPRHSCVIRELDETDSQTQDSGYSTGGFSRCSPANKTLSFGSCTDELFCDLSDLENENSNHQLPNHFSNLITGSLQTKDVSENKTVVQRPMFRRAFSLICNTSPARTNVRSCLFKNDDSEIKNFKRPEPPGDLQSPLTVKRSRVLQDVDNITHIPARPLFQRSVSVTEESIKSAVHRSASIPDLIGDFSKSFCLPLIPGRHQDLKSITPATLVKLMKGEYAKDVASFKVIDCRYPYEFQGGHIVGASNFYTREQIEKELLFSMDLAVKQDEDDRRKNILVFHCEFSSERGPNLSRYLRKLDRMHNKDIYPYLHYPEIYLLDGGYKSFYENYAEYCVPNGYLPMLHPDHEHNLRFYRSKSKTWNTDVKSKSGLRSLKRL